MKKSKFKFLTVSLIILLMMSPVVASANILSWHLVDGGKHLDWKNESDYRSHVVGAMNTWNNHKSGVIREDSWKTIRDVLVQNMNEASNTRGLTSSNGYIKLNKYHLDNDTWSAVRSTVTHEFGHALGIAHTPGSSDVMYMYGNSATTLKTNDKNGYNKSYNRY